MQQDAKPKTCVLLEGQPIVTFIYYKKAYYLSTLFLYCLFKPIKCLEWRVLSAVWKLMLQSNNWLVYFI